MNVVLCSWCTVHHEHRLAPLNMKMTCLRHFEASYLFALENIKKQIVTMRLRVSGSTYGPIPDLFNALKLKVTIYKNNIH